MHDHHTLPDRTSIIAPVLGFYALLLAVYASQSLGADLVKATPEWVVRTFQLPLELDEFALETDGLALSSLPELPTSSASKAEWEAYLRRSNDAMFPILQAQGIPMPPGTAICLMRAAAPSACAPLRHQPSSSSRMQTSC